MLYKNGERSTITEILGTPEKKKAEILKKYQTRAIFTVLPKDLSDYTIESKRGDDIKRPTTPTSKNIPCFYTIFINNEPVEIRYATTKKLVPGTMNEFNYAPSHIEIDKSGVLMVDKPNYEIIFFLKNHPWNKSNDIYKGNDAPTLPNGETFYFQEFESGNRSKELLKKLDMFTLVHNRIRGENKLGDAILRATASRCVDSKMDTQFYDPMTQDIEEIQGELLRLAGNDAETINKMLGSWENEIEILVREAQKRGYLEYKTEGKGWYFGVNDGSAKVLVVNSDDFTDPVRYLITHINTKDTVGYYSILVKALGMKNVVAEMA